MFPFEKSELTLLFFDFISCPFVSKETKKEIIEITKYQLDKNSNKDEIIEKISSEKKWFMDWNLDVDLGKELKKKETIIINEEDELERVRRQLVHQHPAVGVGIEAPALALDLRPVLLPRLQLVHHVHGGKRRRAAVGA